MRQLAVLTSYFVVLTVAAARRSPSMIYSNHFDPWRDRDR